MGQCVMATGIYLSMDGNKKWPPVYPDTHTATQPHTQPRGGLDEYC